MLTTHIQTDAVSLTSNKSVLPFKSAGPGESNFASTLQDANDTVSPVAKSQSNRTPAPAREQQSEKKPAEDSEIDAPAAPALHASLTAKLQSVVSISTLNLATTAQPLAIPGLQVPTDPGSAFTMSSSPGGTVASGWIEDQSKQNVSMASAEQVRNGALTSALTPASTSASVANSIAASLETRKPVQAGDLVLQTTGQMDAAQQVASSSAVQTAVSSAATTPGADNQPAGNPPSEPTGLAVPFPGPQLLAGELPGIVGGISHAHISGSASTVPRLPALEPGTGMPASANRSEQATPLSASPTKNVGVESTKPQLFSTVLKSTDSSAIASAETVKSISSHSVQPVKAMETNLASDIGAKENPGTQVVANQVPSNQEHTVLKTSDAAQNPADSNAQLLPLSAVSVAVLANHGDQTGSTVAVANVLAQVSPLANQISGNRTPSASADSPPVPAPMSPTPAPAVGTVDMARMVAGAAQSEMHIALRSQAFGNIEVHTTVRDSQVGLTVGSERGDLRALLATEVSGLQSTFRQHDLRFDNIRYLESSTGTAAGFSGGANSQPRFSSPGRAPTQESFSVNGPPASTVAIETAAGIPARLNVHA